MPAVMTRRDRVAAALGGRKPDRVPVSAWWHDYEREWSAEGLAETTLEAYRRYEWDYVKVNPRASYYGEAWGALYEPRDGRQPELVKPSVSSPDDLLRIRPLAADAGPFGEQLEALRLIREGLAGEAPFLQTVFSPLATMSRITGSTRYVQRLMREEPDALLAALESITETLAGYSRACLDAGASGIFFATVEWGSADVISAEDYERFARPFDLRVLEPVRGADFNVFHVCRGNNHLLRLVDYPASVFHWDVQAPGNPSFAEARRLTDRALMGGVSHEGTMATGTPDEVTKEARAAIEQTGGQRFFLAPGCSIDPSVTEANRRALVQAARS